MALRVDNLVSFLVSGPSQSGKTHWIFCLIEHRNEIFTEKIADDPPYCKIKDLKGAVLEGTF